MLLYGSKVYECVRIDTSNVSGVSTHGTHTHTATARNSNGNYLKILSIFMQVVSVKILNWSDLTACTLIKNYAAI